MNWNELLQSALTLVVAFAFRWLLSAIGYELDEGIFAALVGALVVWLLSLFGVEVARAAKVRGIK